MPRVGHNRNIVPFPRDGDKYLYVNTSVDLQRIIYLDEDKGFMRTIFNLQKDWFDIFLTFQNLNKDRVNSIFKEDKDRIWYPLFNERNVEKLDKVSLTFDDEVFKVVPNEKFHSKPNSITNPHSAHLFEVGQFTLIIYTIQLINLKTEP